MKLTWMDSTECAEYSRGVFINNIAHIYMSTEAVSHIAIFLWPSSGPHNQLSLGPHTAITYGPSVDQVWIPDKGHTWAITGPIQGQLWVINLAETWASYGPCVALVWNPDLVHTRTMSHCGMWAKRNLILWAGAGPEKNCYVGRSWAREQLLCGMEQNTTLSKPYQHQSLTRKPRIEPHLIWSGELNLAAKIWAKTDPYLSHLYDHSWPYSGPIRWARWVPHVILNKTITKPLDTHPSQMNSHNNDNILNKY